MPCDPSNVYEMLKGDDSLSKIFDGPQYDAHDLLKHLLRKMKHPNHFDINIESIFAFETNIDITCPQCKIFYKNVKNVTDIVLNMRGTQSVNEALQTFFENEFVQKYNCIFCMTSVSASKKRKLLSTPKCLCLIISDSDTDIEINRDLNLKCFAKERPYHWKYELASVIHHVGASYNKQHYNTTVHSNNTVYTLDDSKVLKNEGYAGSHPYILFYERVEEIHIEEPTECIPTIIIDGLTHHNIASEILAVDSNHQKERNKKDSKKAKCETIRPPERPRRVVKRNRQLLDSAEWDTATSSSLPSPKPPISSTKPNLSVKTNQDKVSSVHPNNPLENQLTKKEPRIIKVPIKIAKTGTKPNMAVKANVGKSQDKVSSVHPNNPLENQLTKKEPRIIKVPIKIAKTDTKPNMAVKANVGKSQDTVSIHPNNPSEHTLPKKGPLMLKVPGKIVETGPKPKRFIRLRFQIDCVAAKDVNVDELINFLKNNMKIGGQRNNLAEVTINKRKSNIDIMSKVMLKKKYLKLLSKKYLKKMGQCNYRVIEKNSRGYKIIEK